MRGVIHALSDVAGPVLARAPGIVVVAVQVHVKRCVQVVAGEIVRDSVHPATDAAPAADVTGRVRSDAIAVVTRVHMQALDEKEKIMANEIESKKIIGGGKNIHEKIKKKLREMDAKAVATAVVLTVSLNPLTAQGWSCANCTGNTASVAGCTCSGACVGCSMSCVGSCDGGCSSCSVGCSSCDNCGVCTGCNGCGSCGGCGGCGSCGTSCASDCTSGCKGDCNGQCTSCNGCSSCGGCNGTCSIGCYSSCSASAYANV